MIDKLSERLVEEETSHEREESNKSLPQQRSVAPPTSLYPDFFAMFCLECGIDKSIRSFSDEVHVYQCGYLQCISCVENGAPKPWVSGFRPCISCKAFKHNNFFSHKQLRSTKGSTCVHCMGKATCSLCEQQFALERFSNTQLGKGFRLRRCKDCCPPNPAPTTKAAKNTKPQALNK